MWASVELQQGEIGSGIIRLLENILLECHCIVVGFFFPFGHVEQQKKQQLRSNTTPVPQSVQARACMRVKTNPTDQI